MTRQTQGAETQSYTLMGGDLYDAIYSRKNYEAEAIALKGLISRHKRTEGNELLDVACGTGLHLSYLVDEYQATGVDLSEQQLEAARRRLPDVTFVQGDMRDFDLRRQFDVVTCLFTSIGYIHSYEGLEQSIKNQARHLKPGGVLFVEPWLQPAVFSPGRPPYTEVVESPETQLRVTRVIRGALEGNISILDTHCTIESPSGRQDFTEEHRLAYYTYQEFQQAFAEADLTSWYEEKVLAGRGLYVGLKAL